MRFFLPLVLCFSTIAAPGLAKVSANVPPEYANYRLIDRMEAYQCARPTFRALQPQGHSDLRDALVLPQSGVDGCVAPEWLMREREILLRPAFQNDVRLSTIALHDDVIPLTGIEATVFPAFPLRRGRPTFNGPNLLGEAVLNAEAGREVGIALSVTPGWVGGLDDFKHFNGRFYLHEGYLKLSWRRLELTYGRTALGFGNARHGDLILSGAAKPLNVWKVGVRPSATSAFFGPFSVESWLADQDVTSFVKGARLWGIGIGARPFAEVEVALLQLYQFGGAGAPKLETSDLFKMLYYSGSEELAKKRQRSAALHLGIWGPSNFVKGYFEFFFEDLRSVDALFAEDISVLVGLWFPKIDKAEIRLEYVHTVPGAYGDPFWRQGFTYQGTPLGHPLGEDAEGVYLDVGLPPLNEFRPGVGLFYESRGRTPGALVGATEWRYGMGIELEARWNKFNWQAAARVAKVLNHGNLAGDNIEVAALISSLRYSFF